MSQNLISLDLTADAVAAIDAALDTLEKHFAGFIELTPRERQALPKMGGKSEAFCRQTLIVLDQSKAMLPSTFDLAEAQGDMNAFDTLRSRIQRLRALLSKGEDTQMALGSDILSAAFDGYALAKVSGKGAALEALKEAISVRTRKPRAKPATPDA